MGEIRVEVGNPIVGEIGKTQILSGGARNQYLELTETPKYFDDDELEPLSVYQIVFFDECHKKTDIG
jgi:hypothetical protein